MDDLTQFENRFDERLRAFARTGVKSVDSTAIARSVAAGDPKSARRGLPLDEIHRTHRRPVFGPWRARPMFGTAFATAAVAAALVVAGSIYLIGRPSVTPSEDPSASLPGIVAPSPTPNATGPASSAFPRQEGVWIPTGRMGTPRTDPTAVRLLDGRVLVVGGYGDADWGRITSAELYDPNSGTWSATGNMLNAHEPAGFPATLLRDGRVLVGDVGDPGGKNVYGAEVYDPATGTWTTIGKNVGGGGGATATLLRDGNVLVRGNGGSELYDPDTGAWTATRSSSEQRHSHAAVLLPDGKVLVAGGHITGDDPTDTAELYDPDTGAWTSIASMNAPRESIEAILLPDGTVLVVGGPTYNSADPWSAELYDPATGVWTATGDLANPDPRDVTLTFLSDGTVLTTSMAGTPSAELYDPGTRSWTPAAPMLRSHQSPATLLLDGTVLVAGGSDRSDRGNVATGSAELYVPRGVSPPPLPAFPSPPPAVFPSPTAIPTRFPPQVGPVPPNARSWTVTVVNESSQPATLFVANENEDLFLGTLVGSATPNVVPPGATVQVTFLLPAKGVEGWSIWANPGHPRGGGVVGWYEAPLPGEIRITVDGQVGWLSP